MTNRIFRKLSVALLASTAIASPAFGQDAPPPAPEAEAPVRAASPDEDSDVIIVTATKREENLQDVPVSIQAIGTRRLDQLNISNFEDYTKLLPSVSFQTSQPGSTVVYMRGVATGGDGNHSGSLPSVGSYLDEQPVTTIGGTLDVHIYDVARIESLAGPQGTLYGASSQTGTIRIISNKPELGVTLGRMDAEINKVSHGGWGGSLEGMINLPIADRIAFRGVAFYQRDAGYIDNVFGQRSYFNPNGADFVSENSKLVEKNFNDLRTYGGRAALKIDLDDNWTVTPSLLHQNQKSSGVFFQDDDQGDLEVQRFRPEVGRDRFTQAALTVEGKIANFDLTYSGGYLTRPTYGTSDYTDYTDAYNNYYIDLGYEGLLDYQNYSDNAGNAINPRQHITGTNHFKKMSHELRLASPADNRLRLLAGAFYQRQTNDIFQNYQVDNLAASLSVPDRPGTIWLTKQERIDKDYALFGEATFDVSPSIILTAGGRLYKFDNSLFGFAGFGPSGGPGGFSSGVKRCQTVNGLQARDDKLSALATGGVDGTPCTNVGNVVDGKLVPRRSKGDGFTHRLNAQYKPAEDLMFYATWSRGFRPGGINRQPNAPAYDPDYLSNYELGWKTSFGPVRWNGAIYHQIWRSFQFSFLGENSLTVIQNGRDARVNGIESDVNYTRGGLTLNAAAAYTDAKTKQNICNFIGGNADCDGVDDGGDDDFIVVPKGTRLPVTPKFKASATARYAWPMWTGRAHVQSSLTYRGSASNDIRQDIGGLNPNDAVPKLKAYTLIDAAVGYDWSQYSIEAFASNLFDNRTELTRFVSCNAAYCYRPHTVIGRPRTIGVRVGAKF